MADPSIAVSLSHSVEQLILQICAKQSQPPPDTVARRRLASIGEEESLRLLQYISSWREIRNLSQTIMYISNNNAASPSPDPSPQKKPCLSSPQKQQHGPGLSPQKQHLSPQKSPAKVVRWYANSQGSPSSSSENPTRRAITQGLGLSSSVSDNPIGQAFSPQLGVPSLISENPIGQSFSPQLGEPSSSSEIPNRQEFSPHSIALGELEFRKAFLILSYTAGNRLEDIISADEIRRWKHLEMRDFELRVWDAFGCRFIKQEDRRMSVDWDTGKTYLYHCFVSEDGSYRFKGPVLNKEKTHLQRVLGDDKVLSVKFAEKETNSLATIS